MSKTMALLVRSTFNTLHYYWAENIVRVPRTSFLEVCLIKVPLCTMTSFKVLGRTGTHDRDFLFL